MEAGHRPLNLAGKGDGEWSFVKKDEHGVCKCVFTVVIGIALKTWIYQVP